jgi:aminoglycoside phosphotransferase (APT) family kinase protein
VSNEPTTGQHRAVIERLFPSLGPIESFEPTGEGWTSYTYRVNGEWIAQLPRDEHAETTMVKQLDLLPGLASEVSAQIPRLVHASRDPLAIVYPIIGGEPFTEVPNARDGVWPERLGRFLYDLHLCPPEFVGMRARGADAVRAERRAELEVFRERVFPLLDERERAHFGARFDGYLDDDDNWRFATCLTHGDLGPEHILVTPGGDLTGIIDWEDASVGDPVWDFAYLLHAYPDEGERALAAYGGPPDPAFGERARFGFLQMPWHEVLYGLDHGDEAFVHSGLEGVRARADA